MNKIVKISSIVYVKNGLPYIRECISSIRNQTLKELEIIIVDAGSSDGTVEYIKDEIKKDNRIVFLESEASVGMQFNKALSYAQGKYIAICEADDYILPDAYEKLWKIAQSTDCDVIRADYDQFLGENNRKISFRTHACSKNDKYGYVVKNSDQFFLKEGINGFWNGLYKKDFLTINGILMSETPGASYQDVGFSFKCQCLAKTVYFSNEAFYQYRLDNPNASMNVKNRVVKMICEFENLENWLKERSIWNDYKYEYFNWEMTALKKAYINADVSDKSVLLDLIKNTMYSQIENNQMDIEMSGGVEITSFITDYNFEENKLLCYFQEIHSDNRKIVIFGAGFIGQVVSKILSDGFGKEYSIVDNNKKLQGSLLYGQGILSLESVMNQNTDLVFLIANVNYAFDIKNQLLDAGVNESDIYVCNNDELLLRRLLIQFI